MKLFAHQNGHYLVSVHFLVWQLGNCNSRPTWPFRRNKHKYLCCYNSQRYAGNVFFFMFLRSLSMWLFIVTKSFAHFLFWNRFHRKLSTEHTHDDDDDDNDCMSGKQEPFRSSTEHVRTQKQQFTSNQNPSDRKMECIRSCCCIDSTASDTILWLD